MPIRALTVDDIDTYRSIRLRALTGDPAAFGSDLDRETAFVDTDWIERLRGFRGRPGQIFVDRPTADVGVIGAADVGVVGVGLGDDPTGAVLWGMWVDPTARGKGVGQRLIDAVKAWAATQGATTITLFVMRSNTTAIGLYERAGFELQGDVGGDAPTACAEELRMIFYAAAP